MEKCKTKICNKEKLSKNGYCIDCEEQLERFREYNLKEEEKENEL